MREELILKLNEIAENATYAVKCVINNIHNDDVSMLDVCVSLLNHNIRELNNIMEEEE